MQNRWITMIFIVSAAMNAAFVAAAGYGYFRNLSIPRSCPDAPCVIKKGHHFYEMLGLTQTQLKEMTPMAATFHGQLNDLHADMEIKKQAMISILRGEKAAGERVEALRREMADIQDRIQKTVIVHILDVKSILDADQREHFFDLLNESMTQESQMLIPAGAK